MITPYDYENREKNVSSPTKVKEPSNKIKPFAYPDYKAPVLAAIEDQKKKASKGKILVESLKAGAASMFSSIGSGVNEYNKFIYNKLGNGKDAFGKSYQPTYEKNADKISEFEKKTQEKLIEKIGEDGANTYLSKATMAVSQGVGQIGAFALNPVLGFTTLAAQTIDAGKDAYDTAYRETISEGMDEEKAKKIANINGVVTGSVGMLEAIPIFRVLGLPKGLLSKTISRGVTKTLGRVAKTGATEAGTEGVQQFAQDFTAKKTYDEEGTPLKNAFQSTLISLPTALIFGAAGEINLRARTNALNKAKDEMTEQGKAAGLTPEQAFQVADTIVDQYAVLGDEGIFEENEAQRQDKIIQLIPQIESAVTTGDTQLLNTIKEMALKSENVELRESINEAIKDAEDTKIKLEESRKAVQEGIRAKQQNANQEAALVREASLPYGKKDQFKVLGADGVALVSGTEKRSFKSPELKEVAATVEEKIPNAEYLNRASAEELVQIRDEMSALRESVAKMPAPQFFKEGTEKQPRQPTAVEKMAMKKLGQQINKAIDQTEKQANLLLRDKYKIPEGESPLPKEKQPLQKIDKTETDKKNEAQEKMASRVYERLREEHPDELKDEVNYEAIKLKEDAKKAVELLATDKEKAYRIAMGAEVSSEVTSTAVNIAMADAALTSGNIELFNQLTKIRSFEQTRRGQEIVAEKGSVSDNSTARYVKELINAKMNKLGTSYLSDIQNNPALMKLQKRSTPNRKAVKVIKDEVAKAKKTTQTKTMDLKEAQSFLDKLACA